LPKQQLGQMNVTTFTVIRRSAALFVTLAEKTIPKADRIKDLPPEVILVLDLPLKVMAVDWNMNGISVSLELLRLESLKQIGTILLPVFYTGKF